MVRATTVSHRSSPSRHEDGADGKDDDGQPSAKGLGLECPITLEGGLRLACPETPGDWAWRAQTPTPLFVLITFAGHWD